MQNRYGESVGKSGGVDKVKGEVNTEDEKEKETIREDGQECKR
jgi:hypothetical protein